MKNVKEIKVSSNEELKEVLDGITDDVIAHIEEDKKSMQKNGQLERKLKDLESEKQQLQENFDKKVQEVRERDKTIANKGSLIAWLESLAAAFLVVAYGEHTREVRMSRDKVMKLMTEYKLAYKLDDETGAWIFQIDKNIEGKES